MIADVVKTMRGHRSSSLAGPSRARTFCSICRMGNDGAEVDGGESEQEDAGKLG